MKEDRFVLAADIGGTHITVAVIDLDTRKMLNESLVRMALDSRSTEANIVDVWASAILSAKKNFDVRQLCLAIPGPFDYERGICLIQNQGKYDHLYGLDIKQLLSSKLAIPGLTVNLINDATAFLHGEMFGGAGIDQQQALGITLGTGLGTCVYSTGKSVSADLWDMPFLDGIAEEYLSTRWFIKRYRDRTGQSVTGVSELVTLFDNDGVAEIFNEFGQHLADFIIKFEKIIPSRLVILGGNVSKSFIFFKDSLLERLKTAKPDLVIRTAVLGEHAALLGAASSCSMENLSKA